jgi:hypothetical protein
MKETRTVTTDWQKLKKEERQWTEFKIFNKNIQILTKSLNTLISQSHSGSIMLF